MNARVDQTATDLDGFVGGDPAGHPQDDSGRRAGPTSWGWSVDMGGDRRAFARLARGRVVAPDVERLDHLGLAAGLAQQAASAASAMAAASAASSSGSGRV